MDKSAAVKVFYSYSHKDEELKDELEAHLSILKRKGLIEEWHDRKIVPGKSWKKDINDEIISADIILILVSSDFIASDYCYGVELKRALDRHEANQARVIPIILRPTDWLEESFAKIQALPKDAAAITTWANRDEAWLNVVEGIRKAVNDVKSLRERGGDKFGLLSVQDLLKESIKSIEIKYESKAHCSGVTTGFDDLDRCIDGLHKSDLVIIAGRPEMGKTDLLVNLALNLSIRMSLPVAFFSLKLPADQIMTKLMCAESGVDHARYTRAHMQDTDWPKLTRAAGCIHDINLFIDDSSNLTISGLKNKLISFSAKYPQSIAIIDTLNHLIEFTDPTDDYISFLSRSLKSIAKELGITIIASAPVSRNVELRLDKRPTSVDLDKWACLSDDADVIVFMFNPKYYDPYTESNYFEIILSKNRKGPVCTLDLRYLPGCFRFEEVKEPEVAETGRPISAGTAKVSKRAKRKLKGE